MVSGFVNRVVHIEDREDLLIWCRHALGTAAHDATQLHPGLAPSVKSVLSVPAIYDSGQADERSVERAGRNDDRSDVLCQVKFSLGQREHAAFPAGGDGGGVAQQGVAGWTGQWSAAAIASVGH